MFFGEEGCIKNAINVIYLIIASGFVSFVKNHIVLNVIKLFKINVD